MNQKRNYDFIFSLGEDCACSVFLRDLKLQKASFPFDWLTNATFKTRIDLLVNNFKDFMNFKDFKLMQKDFNQINDDNYDYYENIRNSFYFYHDFPVNTPIKDTFSQVKNKYMRRISRLYEHILKSKNILIVWYSKYTIVEVDEIIDSYKKLTHKFKDNNIDLLILENSSESKENEFKIINISSHITKIIYECRKPDDPNLIFLGNKKKTHAILSEFRCTDRQENALKYIALYLPQYHETKENNLWWGKGFTEWTNVRLAKPFFSGHYQPHEPIAELGYYDLADVTVMIKQAAMAKKFGIHGFCYYYYWFNGKTLLEKPLLNMLRTPEVDISFCLCWANHNWTRRWDGLDQEILIEQTYDQNTYKHFIDDLEKYFRDERYIKIDGKPVLVVYQADQVKNPKEAVQEWRNHAIEKYGHDLYLLCAHQSSCVNPHDLGYDGAVDFTPTWRAEDVITYKENFYDKRNKSLCLDYNLNTLKTIVSSKPDYDLYKCVYPMWDNSPRRKLSGATILVNGSFESFEMFLVESSKYTVRNFPPDRRFVFFNAWNEWGEGTHLEPCKKFGYTLLEICKKVISMSEEELLKHSLPENLFNYIKHLFPEVNSSEVIQHATEIVERQKKHKELFHLKAKLIAGWKLKLYVEK